MYGFVNEMIEKYTKKASLLIKLTRELFSHLSLATVPKMAGGRDRK